MSTDIAFDKIYLGLIIFITFGLIVALLVITAIYVDTKQKLKGLSQCGQTLDGLRQENCSWTAQPKIQ